jgi:hypothetical protein
MRRNSPKSITYKIRHSDGRTAEVHTYTPTLEDAKRYEQVRLMDYLGARSIEDIRKGCADEDGFFMTAASNIFANDLLGFFYDEDFSNQSYGQYMGRVNVKVQRALHAML